MQAWGRRDGISGIRHGEREREATTELGGMHRSLDPPRHKGTDAQHPPQRVRGIRTKDNALKHPGRFKPWSRLSFHLRATEAEEDAHHTLYRLTQSFLDCDGSAGFYSWQPGLWSHGCR
ncbi:unnamed protein product [Lota lota]